MDLVTYQKMAKETAVFPEEFGVEYTTLGLTSEAGEVAGKVKKILRDHLREYANPDLKAKVASEMGDVLWYLAMLAEKLGLSLDEIAQDNLNKLYSRKERGKIKGSGDER